MEVVRASRDVVAKAPDADAVHVGDAVKGIEGSWRAIVGCRNQRAAAAGRDIARCKLGGW